MQTLRLVEGFWRNRRLVIGPGGTCQEHLVGPLDGVRRESGWGLSPVFLRESDVIPSTSSLQPNTSRFVDFPVPGSASCF